MNDSLSSKVNSGRLRFIGEQRLAMHYQKVLRSSDELYMQGGEAILHGMALFDLERSNIEAGYAWSVQHAAEDMTANGLCVTYPDHGAHVLDLRMSPRERIRWVETAIDAVRRSTSPTAKISLGILLDSLGSAYNNLGEHRKAIEFHKQSLGIMQNQDLAAVDLGERRKTIGRTFSNLGLASVALGELDKALKFYEQSLAIAKETGDLRIESQVHGNLGAAYFALAQPSKAIEHFDRQLTIVEETGDLRAKGEALGGLGLGHGALGNARKAIEFCEQSLVIAKETGEWRAKGRALSGLGSGYAALGEHRKAIEFYDQSLDIEQKTGDRRGEALALLGKAVSVYALGRCAEAIDSMETACRLFEEMGNASADVAEAILVKWRGSSSS